MLHLCEKAQSSGVVNVLEDLFNICDLVVRSARKTLYRNTWTITNTFLLTNINTNHGMEKALYHQNNS